MSGEEEREGFLARWSRRKRAVQAGEAAEPAAPETAPALPAAPAPASPPAAPEEPEFDLSSLPKIEELTAESDLKPFFAKGVPLALRQAAVSRMWSLDPAIRDFVGPADYAWDFNAPDGVPGFGLELPEEVKALARRLLGVDREEQDRAAQVEARAGAQPATHEAEGSPGTVPMRADTAPPPDFLPPTLAPEVPPEPAADPEPDPPRHRRHGSALPA